MKPPWSFSQEPGWILLAISELQMFWADLGQLHFNRGQKALTLSLCKTHPRCAASCDSTHPKWWQHWPVGDCTKTSVKAIRRKRAEGKSPDHKHHVPPLNRERYLQVLQSAKSHTEAHRAKPCRSLLIQDALARIQSPSERQPFTSVGLLTRLRMNQRAQLWSLLWSQPKGSGGAEISLA